MRNSRLEESKFTIIISLNHLDRFRYVEMKLSISFRASVWPLRSNASVSLRRDEAATFPACRSSYVAGPWVW